MPGWAGCWGMAWCMRCGNQHADTLMAPCINLDWVQGSLMHRSHSLHYKTFREAQITYLYRAKGKKKKNMFVLISAWHCLHLHKVFFIIISREKFIWDWNKLPCPLSSLVHLTVSSVYWTFVRLRSDQKRNCKNWDSFIMNDKEKVGDENQMKREKKLS